MPHLLPPCRLWRGRVFRGFQRPAEQILQLTITLRRKTFRLQTLRSFILPQHLQHSRSTPVPLQMASATFWKGRQRSHRLWRNATVTLIECDFTADVRTFGLFGVYCILMTRASLGVKQIFAYGFRIFLV